MNIWKKKSTNMMTRHLDESVDEHDDKTCAEEDVGPSADNPVAKVSHGDVIFGSSQLGPTCDATAILISSDRFQSKMGDVGPLVQRLDSCDAAALLICSDRFHGHDGCNSPTSVDEHDDKTCAGESVDEVPNSPDE